MSGYVLNSELQHSEVRLLVGFLWRRARLYDAVPIMGKYFQYFSASSEIFILKNTIDLHRDLE